MGQGDDLGGGLDFNVVSRGHFSVLGTQSDCPSD